MIFLKQQVVIKNPSSYTSVSSWMMPSCGDEFEFGFWGCHHWGDKLLYTFGRFNVNRALLMTILAKLLLCYKKVC